MASATADQAAAPAGAAALRRALLATLLATTLATCAAGWLFKAHCLFDGGWSHGEQYATGCYSDAVPFWDLREVGAGKLPYFQARMEYPVLTGALIYVDGRITKAVFGEHAHPPQFLAIVTLVNTLLALIVTWLLWLIGLSAARLRLWALSPLLVLYVGHNWDLLAVALAVGALALAERGLLVRAAAVAALGGAAKLFPLYLLPLLALGPLLERRIARVAAMVAAAVIAWGLVNLPVAALAYVNWSEFYAFSGTRGGTAASVWELAGQFGWLTTSIAQRNFWSGLLFLAGGGAIVAAGWRWHRDRPWLLVTPVVVWFLLVNKVYSPQFDLWVYPLMLISARRLAPVRLFVVGDFLAYFAEFWIFAGQEHAWPATGQGTLLVAATLRAGAMLWIIGDAVTARPSGDSHDDTASGLGPALRWIASAIGAYMTAGMTDRSPLAPATFPTLPDIAGVTPHVARARYKEWDRCDLTFVTLAPGTSVAGVLTQSRCPSPEVEWCRQALVLGQARALVVNAGNSNAFTGSRGRAAVETIAARAARHLGCRPSDIFIASTGVIGVPLPIDRAEAGLDAAFAAAPCSWEDAATAIGTTDTFAKAAMTTALVDGRAVSLVGIVKGSGMIAPDMATMLGFIFTDAAVDPVFLQAALADANAKSFSCITVDGDTSTSDSVLAFATGRAGNAPLAAPDDAGADAFRAAMADLCLQLAHLVVRDGEGATKFVRIDVTGAQSDASAHRIALSIANSPLVKTAIAGEDANWGRVVMAVGKAGEPAERDRLAIRFGHTQVARDGLAVEGYDEAPVAAHLQGSEIEIGVDLGLGDGRATAWTCDLTHGYIAINADYRS